MSDFQGGVCAARPTLPPLGYRISPSTQPCFLQNSNWTQRFSPSITLNVVEVRSGNLGYEPFRSGLVVRSTAPWHTHSVALLLARGGCMEFARDIAHHSTPAAAAA